MAARSHSAVLSFRSVYPRFCWTCVSRGAVRENTTHCCSKQRQVTRSFSTSAARSCKLCAISSLCHARPNACGSYAAPSTIHPRHSYQFHTTAYRRFAFAQRSLGSATSSDQNLFERSKDTNKPMPGTTIRETLRQWQKEHGKSNVDEDPENHFNIYPSADQEGMETEDLELEYRLDQEDGFADAIDPASKLRPGDLCLLMTTRHTPSTYLNLAIYVEYMDKRVSTFLTAAGQFQSDQARSVLFRIPGFVSEAEISKLKPYIPVEDTRTSGTEQTHFLDNAPKESFMAPPQIVTPFRRALSQVQERYVGIYREHHRLLDSAYDILARPTEDTIASLSTLSSQLFRTDDPSMEHRLAVHLALARAGPGVNIITSSFDMMQQYRLRSKDSLNDIDTVMGWLRSYKAWRSAQSTDQHLPNDGTGINIVAGFIAKARELIAFSRTIRDLSDLPTKYPLDAGLGPSKLNRDANAPVPVESTVVKATFDRNERLIIKLLRQHAVERSLYSETSVSALIPTIIHGTGAYPGKVTTVAVAYLFLQEIGVLTPYEYRRNFKPEMMLPGLGHSGTIDNLYAKASREELFGEDFVDSMAHLRKDWGQLPVYCIDDALASELDDGISVEVVTGSPSPQWWIHIHIANPTAFIPARHTLSALASHLVATTYAGSRGVSMLPKWVSQNHFSLQPNRPVLTFSGRFDSQGSMLESKIQSGVIHNVISTTRQAVDQALGSGGEEHEFPIQFTVGGPIPKSEIARPLQHEFSSSQVKDLEALYEIVKIIDRRHLDVQKNDNRLYMMSAFHGIEGSLVEAVSCTGKPLPVSVTNTDKAIFHKGDPVIHLRAKPWDTKYNPESRANLQLIAKGIVETCMSTACAIGASWARDRNIPLYYRGTYQHTSDEKFDRFHKNVFLPSLDENGRAPFHIQILKTGLGGKTYISTTPVHHGGLGLDAYTHVTSPLRRYMDMIAHWQIEGALRAEAEAGKALTYDTLPPGSLPFSKDQLDSALTRIASRTTEITRINVGYKGYWVNELIRRAVNFNELPDFPRIVTCMVMRSSAELNGNLQVAVREFTYFGTMLSPFTSQAKRYYPNVDHIQPKAGSIWECEIKEIHQYNNRGVMAPIRWIEDWQPPGEGFDGEEFLA